MREGEEGEVLILKVRVRSRLSWGYDVLIEDEENGGLVAEEIEL